MRVTSSQTVVSFLVISVLAATIADSIRGETYSLSRDFSIEENVTDGIWSYRLDDSNHENPEFPLLTDNERDANEIWGAVFDDSPRMWSGPSGYWGIGKNFANEDKFSPHMGSRWPAGKIFLHPKAGDVPNGLVICWTAPARAVIDVTYIAEIACVGTDGVGLTILRRRGDSSVALVRTPNIGAGIENQIKSIPVEKGDRLLLRFDTASGPGGDVVLVDVTVSATWLKDRAAPPAQVSGGTIAAGSSLTLHAPEADGGKFQWIKNGEPINGATSDAYQIENATADDSGDYSVLINSTATPKARLDVAPLKPLRSAEEMRAGMPRILFPSKTPHQVFSDNPDEAERELASNVLIRRFAESRKRQASDPHRPLYHFVSPENMLNDPNGLCFWKGKWHLFYQAYPADEFPDPKDILNRRQHWGHAVSEDLVYWRDLPYAIYPGIERMCFSGSTVVDDDKVVAYYPGIHAGQMVATADDDLLLNWTKLGGKPVNSPSGDACIWKEGDTYFGLVGANHLTSSKNLTDWKSHGAFIADSPFDLGDYLACPNFVPLGSKHLLLSFSHLYGGQYLIGNYDRESHKFTPYERGLFNHGNVAPGGVHAPSAASDGKGGVINILNINDGMYNENWDQLMSLPQQLTLGDDERLRIRPVEAITKLRGEKVSIGETVIPANKEIVLNQVRGNAMEMQFEIDPKEARWVQINVLRSANAEEQTALTFYNYDRRLAYWYHTKGVVCLDTSRSSTLPDAWMRPPDRANFERHGEPLKLRIFVDRSVVEVFVNERLYMAARVYPGRKDSVGVSLRAQGQDAVLKSLDAWQMKSIWPEAENSADHERQPEKQ